MDKKVWAIIAIIALHLTLMWLIRGSLKPEELARGGGVTNPDVSPIEPNPYLAPTILAAEQAAVDEAAKPGQRAAESSPKKLQRFETASRRPTLAARSGDIAAARGIKAVPGPTVAFTAPVFADTIIWVKRSEVLPLFQPERAAVIEPKEPKPVSAAPVNKKKRSFFKKALPVIRKPYDWIKTLVSKL